MTFATWSDWNDAYTKALQKQNRLIADFNKAWKEPDRQRRLAKRVQAAKGAAEAIRTHPDRPASQVTYL